jgi:hypothetical protein
MAEIYQCEILKEESYRRKRLLSLHNADLNGNVMAEAAYQLSVM